MSLVICANTERDLTQARSGGGLNNAWSFRNTLSSTYNIPANSQVALQSCKMNIDGRVVVSRDNANFYHYFGQKLNLDGETAPQEADTTSAPVLSSLLDDTEEGQVLEVSKSDTANLIQSAIRRTSYHPNTKNMATCEILKNASNLDFQGYKISFDQAAAGATKPTTLQDWYGNDQPSNGSGIWTFAADKFTRNASASLTDVCAAIGKQYPLSTHNKSLVVNISGSNANANASGVEWHVGLSRFINHEAHNGLDTYTPFYYDSEHDDQLDTTENVFMDFAVARNYSDELVCYHSTSNGFSGTKKTEVQYWNNTNGSFSALSARKSLTGTNYTQVKINVYSERVEAQIYNNTTKVWETITTYKVTTDKTDMFKPVNQACWCLHPVLAIGSDSTNTTCSLEIDSYGGMDITGYDATTAFKGGWYETMEILGVTGYETWDLEMRSFNDVTDSVVYDQIWQNASGGVDYDHVFILQESDIYTDTANANAKSLLGFEKAVVDKPFLNQGSKKIYNSTAIPSTANLLSMFVRLDNLGQSVVNALTGNDSKIIAHITSVETAIGRRTYEPSSLIFVDLNNPSDMNISDFNISFCYANEQYATILQGQSIVCLYIRPKPKMLM
tara:strand:- start:2553 stop:4397 length:1845 start_codon:yes stop_codon:yes gene_type:complete